MLDFVLLTLLYSCIQAYFPTVMARGDLSLVRDALVTDTIREIIDDEFVLLYDAYYPRTAKFDINTLSEDKCHAKL